MENTKRIIEINGVKMEVDLRNAKVIENYKVGDNVKVLVKKYSDNYESHLGVIIAFDDFTEHPTIVIAYLDLEYSSASIKFLYYNSASKDIEITSLNEWDLPLQKSDLLKKFDKEIATKEQELKEIQQKMNVFEKLFGKYFERHSPVDDILNKATN